VIESDLTALLDTGSDKCVVDSALAEKHKLSDIGKAKSQTMTGTEYWSNYVLFVSLYDNDINKEIRVRLVCASTNIRLRGQPFDLILGMEFIRHFDLEIARSRGVVSLQVVQ
jgi:Aspartyl protease